MGRKPGRQRRVVCCLVKGGHDGYESTAEGDLVTRVTRNKSDIKLRSDLVAGLQEEEVANDMPRLTHFFLSCFCLQNKLLAAQSTNSH